MCEPAVQSQLSTPNSISAVQEEIKTCIKSTMEMTIHSISRIIQASIIKAFQDITPSASSNSCSKSSPMVASRNTLEQQDVNHTEISFQTKIKQ